MIAMGGVGFTITALVEILGVHRYHSFLRPAVLMGLLCYVSAITMLMVELGRPWKVWMVLISWAPTSALYEVGWCAFLYLNVLGLRLGDLQQPVIGRTVVLKAGQLVARRAEGASRSMRELRKRGRRLPGSCRSTLPSVTSDKGLLIPVCMWVMTAIIIAAYYRHSARMPCAPCK